tara:strand:- start:4721 stop:5953 length:1233 start_codon:yes stop_codon:yes gene_type:complete
MSRQTRNQDLVVVGKTAALTAAPASMNALVDGEVRLFTPKGVVIGAGNVTANMTFKVVIGGPNGKPKFVSESINGAIAQYVPKGGLPGAEQLDYIGFNGTSGSIDEIDNNLYMATAYVEEYLTASSDGRYIKHFQFKSKTTGAKQSEVALGLAKSGQENWSREAKNVNGDSFMGFKAVCNQAIAAEANTIDIVKGSNTILAGGALTAVAGDFIRIGNAASDIALDGVYKVLSINGLVYTLDRKVGETTRLAAPTTDVSFITAAQGAAANWGVAVNANVKDHVTGKEFYKKNRFTLNLGEDFGSTTITLATGASRGIGVIEDVRDHEWFSAGNLGETYRMGEPVINTLVSNVDITTGTFDTATIQWTDGHLVGFQDEMSPKLITIYSPRGADGYMTNGANGTSAMLAAIVA